MNGSARTALRALFVVVLVLSAGTVAASYAAADASVAERSAGGGTGAASPTSDGAESSPTPDGAESSPTPDDAETSPTPGSGTDTAAGTATTIGLESQINRSNVSEARTFTGPLTVVATQGFYVSDENAELVAFSDAGEVVYHDATYRVYFDVDPVAGTRHTVEYVAAKHLSGEICDPVGTDRCTRNVVNRVNLTTGEETRVYGKVTPRIYSARWHDVDRLNGTHFVVADIINDSVNVVNGTSGEVISQWRADAVYNRSTDGGNPGDWTHINDVELLDDGRIMASLRNMDEVVFIERRDGSWVMDDSWTLGEEDDHSILYEQHNPDYIPEERGGPAIVVGDSENGRVVEYQRVNGSWERSWGWKDARLQWPRDADRLPSGNTLIVDSHGDRVVEVRPDGSIVWTVTIGMPYDAERLGTGDESAGGRSMRAIQAAAADERGGDEQSAVEAVEETVAGDGGEPALTTPDRGPVATFWVTLKDLTPSLVVNGLLYTAPSWVRFTDLVFAFVFLGTALTWGGSEFYWSGRTVRGGLRRAAGLVRRLDPR